MNEGILSTLRDNFDWLRRDGNDSEALRRALLKEVSSLLGTNPSPSELAKTLDFLGVLDARHTALTSELICEYRLLNQTAKYDAPKRVSYLRSRASDRAFRIFSEQYGDMSANYGADFKSVCEDVYTERADACILPLESSDSGLLMSFRTLALKYELSLYSACRVRQNDESVLTLALMTANFDGYGNRNEIYLPSVSVGALETLSCLASSLDCRMLRVLTVSSEYDGEYDIHACIQVPDAELHEKKENALRLCLEALYPSYISLGNYLLINDEKE